MSKKIFSLALGAMLLALSGPVDAQQIEKIPRIGFLFSGDLSEASARIEAFRQGLRELGYVEGKNIVIEQRSSGEKPDILSNLAGELVSLKVATIVTMGTEPTQAAKDATGTIPIVMTYVSDPIGFGFVASLARPDGNITGLTNLGPELSGKRLELLKEVLPQTSRVIVLLSPGNPIHTFLLKEMQVPAGALGIKLLSLELRGRSPKQVDEAFGTLKYSHSDALMVLPPPFNSLAMKRIVDLAVKKRLPTTYHWKEYVEAGGLMYYGANLPDMYRRAATYVDKILKGAKPADLPVEQPTKFELVINLKAAKQIGLTIPPNMLVRADKVIK
jgi:putative ABC transport system substrate-binding protein